MRTAIWKTGAAISAAALVLAACNDADDDSSIETDGADAGAEVTEDTTPEDPPADDDAGEGDLEDDSADEDEDDSPDEGGDSLSPEDISALLLDEGEFPVEFEHFEAFADTEDGAAEALGSDVDLGLGNGAFGTHTGIWANPESDAFDMHMLQVGILDYETMPEDFDSEDLDLSGSGLEELGMEELEDYDMDIDSEEISYNGWEGAIVRTSVEVGGQTVETESSTLTRVEGTTVLYVSATGEGQEYLEEIADLQWEKYEAGR